MHSDDGKTYVLDHGYVKLVESWGSDRSVIEAARMSTGKGFLGWGPDCPECRCNTYQNVKAGDPCPTCGTKLKAGDEKLLRYLYENRHDTPFEMGGLTVEVQAPLFVFREWHRHRVPWSYNEASARYAPLPALDYVPSLHRLFSKPGHGTEQAATIAGAKALTLEYAAQWQAELVRLQERAEALYRAGLEAGIPKELARGAMTVNRYSRMRASANLRGWLHFVGLRAAPNAQQEIQDYAVACARILAQLFPRTWALFDERHREKYPRLAEVNR